MKKFNIKTSRPIKLSLLEIDLSKAKEHECPGIKADSRTHYLVRHHGGLFAGTFNRQWFGLSFDGWHAPLQFDAPGFNSSKWQQVWEIRRK